MTINCFVIGVKQYLAFVGRHLKTAPLRYVAIACRRRIENHLLITRLKRHFHHLIAAAQLIIAFAINRRQDCANAFLTLPQHCIAQGEFLGKYTSHRQQCNNQKYKSLHFVIKNFTFICFLKILPRIHSHGFLPTNLHIFSHIFAITRNLQ